MIDDSASSCDYVRSVSECESAARELELSDLSATHLVTAYDQYPPFCFIFNHQLYFSAANTGPCAANAKCLCKENNFCAKIPCGEGQGDCDDDTECEGSLVCGHMNCMNSTVTDCCTQPCNNDSDCTTSGECNAEHNQCHLWPMCSQDSPCADGEGDCDHHTDCEGGLLCGIDNCMGGPTYLDCCTGRSIMILIIYAISL